MSEPKPLSPADAMRALLDEADRDAAEAVDAVGTMSPAEVDEELRAAGVDPEAAAKRARVAIDAALAAVPASAPAPAPTPAPAPAPAPASAPSPSNVVPLPSKRAGSRNPALWTAVAAAAVLVLAIGILRKPGEGDLVGHGDPGTPAERAAKARADALDACGARDFDACERGLDQARELDPVGEDDPKVRDARDAIRAAHGTAPRPSTSTDTRFVPR